MRRLVSLVVLLLFTVPFGLSVTGCSKSAPAVFCNGADSGPVVGQVASISLAPTLAATGVSLSYGQSGPTLQATAEDCKGNAVSVTSYVYATSDTSLTYADINPKNGSVCAGTWNRNSGAGIPDYSTCKAPATTPTTHLAYVTATANGAVSNSIPVWTHATVASVQITGTSAGTPGSTACTTNPTSDCCAVAVTGTPAIYAQNTCVSQGTPPVRLIAKVFDSGGNNITCQVGNLTFAPQGTATNNIVTIDTTGVATPNQPGSTVITATIANSGSANTAGYFSTCPPAKIVLTAQGQTPSGGPISVPVNQAQSFTTTITDTNGNTITGLSLQYESTSPQTVTAGATITPSFPGTTAISAICQPPSCNPAPFSQIGLFGNGKPVTSNSITVNTTGNSSTVLYVASTQSQYLFPLDFTTGQQQGTIKLPYIPNSMVISQDGTTVYLGSSLALMTFSTASNTVTAANTTVVGDVLAVSPDNSTVAVVDPTRQTISLVTSSGTVSSTYNAVVPTVAAGAPFPIRAEWSPDSQTLYITGTLDANNNQQLLVHSIFNGWLPISSDEAYSDVAVMVPAVGAYFAGKTTEGRSYCATSTAGNTGTPPTVSNINYPLSDSSVAAPTDRVAATSDGFHILGATATAPAALTDVHVSPSTPVSSTQLGGPLSCAWATAGITFASSYNSYPLTGIAASAITGVVPANTSALSFVTYTGTSTNPAGQLPMYIPSTSTGTLSFIPLSGSATAPVAGVFNTTDLNFYAGTSGDNLVHIINVTTPTSGAPTAVDSGSSLTPNLPCASSSGTYGTPVPACSGATTSIPNLIVQRPKKSSS